MRRALRLLAALIACLFLALAGAEGARAQQAGGDGLAPGEVMGPLPEIALPNADRLLAGWEQSAAEVEEAIRQGRVGPEEALALRAVLEPQRNQARRLSDVAKEEGAPIKAQLDALGPAPAEGESEDAEIAGKRQSLRAQLDSVRAVGSRADLAFTRADRLLADIANAQRRRFTERLLTRGPTPLNPAHWITAGERIILTATRTAGEVAVAAREPELRAEWSARWPYALGLILLAVVLMFVLRRRLLAWLFARLDAGRRETIDEETEAAAYGGMSFADGSAAASGTLPPPVTAPAPSRLRRLGVGIGVTLVRLALPVLAIVAVAWALRSLDVLGEAGLVALRHLAEALILLAVGTTLVQAYFAPAESRLRLSAMTDRRAVVAAWLAALVVLSLAIDRALVGTGQERGYPIEALSVISFASILLGAVSLFRLCMVAAPDEHPVTPGEETNDSDAWLSERLASTFRRLGYVVAVAAPMLAALGYFAASRYLFHNALLTLGIAAVGVLIFSVGQEGASALLSAARDRRGEARPAEEERLSLLPVLFGFVLILGALPMIALVWGATAADLEEAYFAITNGFTVGETTFRPGDIIVAAVVFGIGLFLTRLIQAVTRRTVMPRTRLDTGARSSIVAGLGYVGFFVSILLAIGAAGLDLTNLAFLGAALGVGIGFGLQNIVNNFVSGIILLIERPIKVGDWIQVAGVHGIVEKVNVRSTEIKTFDKASYIVPNSELISGAVTNMTHGDMLGRAICPVGVGYGTDTRKVERVLLEVARAHPMGMRNPPPHVLFKGFGASSLDFELRLFLRDVMYVNFVQSDLNHEIDRRFAEEGIEIPYPQTDMHLKDAHGIIEAFTAARDNREAAE